MMLYICLKFHQNIRNGFQLTEGMRVHSRNGYFSVSTMIKWAATPKIGLSELHVLCSARCLMLLYISEKFHNI